MQRVLETSSGKSEAKKQASITAHLINSLLTTLDSLLTPLQYGTLDFNVQALANILQTLTIVQFKWDKFNEDLKRKLLAALQNPKIFSNHNIIIPHDDMVTLLRTLIILCVPWGKVPLIRETLLLAVINNGNPIRFDGQGKNVEDILWVLEKSKVTWKDLERVKFFNSVLQVIIEKRIANFDARRLTHILCALVNIGARWPKLHKNLQCLFIEHIFKKIGKENAKSILHALEKCGAPRGYIKSLKEYLGRSPLSKEEKKNTDTLSHASTIQEPSFHLASSATSLDAKRSTSTSTSIIKATKTSFPPKPTKPISPAPAQSSLLLTTTIPLIENKSSIPASIQQLKKLEALGKPWSELGGIQKGCFLWTLGREANAWNAQDIETILWGLAKLGATWAILGEDDLKELLRTAITRNVESFGAQGVINILWALVIMEAELESQELLQNLIMPNLGKFTSTREVIELAWSAALLGIPDIIVRFNYSQLTTTPITAFSLVDGRETQLCQYLEKRGYKVKSLMSSQESPGRQWREIAQQYNAMLPSAKAAPSSTSTDIVPTKQTPR